jgi:two-component system, OmpR family, sensor histidine kinase ChvG
MALDSNDIASAAALDNPASEIAAPEAATTRPKFDLRGVFLRAANGMGSWIAKGWIARAIGKNLRRRILLANLLGLAGLLGAMLYLSLHHGWLLDAKVDVVKTVSRITAEAIAYRAFQRKQCRAPSATTLLRRWSCRSTHIKPPSS